MLRCVDLPLQKIFKMKKIVILSLLSLGLMVSAQSRIEKYNSTLKRYEYYDGDGNLIGYKKYNNLSNQWEYFQENDTQYRKRDRSTGMDELLKSQDETYRALLEIKRQQAQAEADRIIAIRERQRQQQQQKEEMRKKQDIENQSNPEFKLIPTYKEKISQNLNFIKNNVLSDSKYNHIYDKFFREIIPGIQSSLNSNNIIDVKWALLTSDQVVKNYTNNPKWFH